MTPPLLALVRCPCSAEHWEIDMEHRWIEEDGPDWSERDYHCPECGRAGPAFERVRSSPPGLLIGRWSDVTTTELAEWLQVLETWFPDHPARTDITAELARRHEAERPKRSRWPLARRPPNR